MQDIGTGECPGPSALSEEHKRLLLDWARRTLVERATTGMRAIFEPETVPAELEEHRGCFVTLFLGGELRGCIGHVLPQMALYRAVMENVVSAAFHDPRFEPVSAREAGVMEIEISVLSALQELPQKDPEEKLHALRPGIDGVLLRRADRMSTFLPQVWEQLPDPEVFLGRLCQKAGWQDSAWRLPDTSISTYQVVSFGDHPEKGFLDH